VYYVTEDGHMNSLVVFGFVPRSMDGKGTTLSLCKKYRDSIESEEKYRDQITN